VYDSAQSSFYIWTGIFSFYCGPDMNRVIRTLAIAGTLLIGAHRCLAEQIDNPQYKSWAKFKEGTSVTIHVTTDMAGSKTEMDTTMTLVSLTADKAVVESKSSIVVADSKIDMPADKMDVPAKIDKPKTTATGTAPAATTSNEEVDVAGTKVKCVVTTTTTSSKGVTTISKIWTSDQVPGSTVKSETTADGGTVKGASSITVTAMTIK
jgi:hypothetical protein